MNDELLITATAAPILGVAPITLKNSRYTGLLGDKPAPPYLKIGKKVRYLRSDLLEYLRGCRVVPTDRTVA